MSPRIVLRVVFIIFISVLGMAVFMEPRATVSSANTLTANTQMPSTQAPPLVTTTQTPPHASGYTLAEVAQHGDGTSCWVAINGNVYDLTSWINKHPGGPEAILSICGTDATAAFTAQHSGQRRPESELANFKIGLLAS